ncbi:MAG: helix-turn-helix domain-containing protein [Clostridia bacterium]|nr:helix-turn-helix domain-containing protein [Clostridia bacterium]
MKPQGRIKELVFWAQNGDKQAKELLIKQFAPAIKKYSKRLNVEEAENDLCLWVINAINQYKL